MGSWAEARPRRAVSTTRACNKNKEIIQIPINQKFYTIPSLLNLKFCLIGISLQTNDEAHVN